MPLALAAFDLTPEDGLTPGVTPRHWHVREPVVAFTADSPLAPGWYRLRLQLHTPDQPAILKRITLTAASAGQTTLCEEFSWNTRLREQLYLQISVPTDRLRLQLRHAQGHLSLERFELRKVSPARALARAVRLKVGLLTRYQCFWPVLARGGKLLAEGRVREFGQKLFKGHRDARTLRIEVKQAAEANAAWWRRRALPADEARQLREQADQIPEPLPITVIIPADPTRENHVRHAFLSVCLQVYPHWQVIVAWPNAHPPARLQKLIHWERRARIVCDREGVGAAVLRAVQQAPSPHILICPPDWELSERALLDLALGRLEQPSGGSLATTCPEIDSEEGPWYEPALHTAASLTEDPLPPGATLAETIRWVGARPTGSMLTVPEPLAYPMNAGPVRSARIQATSASGPSLVFSANIRGITGWDYLAFTVLNGLQSLGFDLRKPHDSDIKSELIPPDAQPRKIHRAATDPQLIVAPPFGLGQHTIDDHTAIFTMWETDTLEPRWVAWLNRARLVLVPSQWAVECFRACGVRVPLAVVPLGYDPLVFHPGPAPQGSLCTFGTAGALSAGGLRKNVARVVRLFREAFPTEEDVRLRVKITPNCPPFDIPNDPRIEVLRAALPHADLATWNRSLTCYVNASFAEGFGLHLLEAMACGRPLISTQATGVREFFDERVGHVIPHRMVPVQNEVYRGHWADPDDAALIAAMQSVYRDRDQAVSLGYAAAARARQFTWRDSGRLLTAALAEHGLLQPAGEPARELTREPACV